MTEWKASRLSRREFAIARGVHVQTLSWWAWRWRARPAGPPGFVDVVVTDVVVARAPDFVVEVSGVRVRVPAGFDAGELRRLVGALC